MPEDVITSKDRALMAMLEKYFLQEKANDEEDEKKLREFAQQLDKDHVGWVDLNIFKKTVPLRLMTESNEIASEQMQHNRFEEIRPALYWFFVSIPVEARGTTEPFTNHATREFINKFNNSIGDIFVNCKGEIVYYVIEHGKAHGIIVFKPKDVDTSGKVEQTKSQIDGSLSKTFNVDDGCWDVNLLPVQEWGDVSATMVQKRNEMNAPKSFRQ